MKIFISSSPVSLAIALAPFTSTATVEAEFGDELVEGTALTLAHHGPRKASPPPCCRMNTPIEGLEAIGLSHVDLDALGGVMSILGCKPENHDFWRTAGEVDVRGVHKLGSIPHDPTTRERLNAWWAWSEAHRTYPPRDGSAADCTAAVEEAISALTFILGGFEPLLAAGAAWAQQEAALNAASYRKGTEDVILRVSDAFCNHLYACVNGTVAKAVVGFNPDRKNVTVSLADPIPGISCREIVQALWGPLAGGHDGIAGSPRGQEMTEADANAAMASMQAAISAEEERFWDRHEEERVDRECRCTD